MRKLLYLKRTAVNQNQNTKKSLSYFYDENLTLAITKIRQSDLTPVNKLLLLDQYTKLRNELAKTVKIANEAYPQSRLHQRQIQDAKTTATSHAKSIDTLISKTASREQKNEAAARAYASTKSSVSKKVLKIAGVILITALAAIVGFVIGAIVGNAPGGVAGAFAGGMGGFAIGMSVFFGVTFAAVAIGTLFASKKQHQNRESIPPVFARRAVLPT